MATIGKLDDDKAKEQERPFAEAQEDVVGNREGNFPPGFQPRKMSATFGQGKLDAAMRLGANPVMPGVGIDFGTAAATKPDDDKPAGGGGAKEVDGFRVGNVNPDTGEVTYDDDKGSGSFYSKIVNPVRNVAQGAAGAASVADGVLEDGFYDWYLDKVKKEHEADEKRRNADMRKLQRQKVLTRVGDALSAMHEAYSHARGVEPMKLPQKSLSERWSDRYKELTEERAKDRKQYMDTYIRLAQQKRLNRESREKNRWTDLLNQQKLEAAYQRAKDDADKAAADAERLRQQAEYYKAQGQKAAADALLREAEAKEKEANARYKDAQTKGQELKNSTIVPLAQSVINKNNAQGAAATTTAAATAKAKEADANLKNRTNPNKTSSNSRSGGKDDDKDDYYDIEVKTDSRGRTSTTVKTKAKKESKGASGGGSSGSGGGNSNTSPSLRQNGGRSNISRPIGSQSKTPPGRRFGGGRRNRG